MDRVTFQTCVIYLSGLEMFCTLSCYTKSENLLNTRAHTHTHHVGSCFFFLRSSISLITCYIYARCVCWEKKNIDFKYIQEDAPLARRTRCAGREDAPVDTDCARCRTIRTNGRYKSAPSLGPALREETRNTRKRKKTEVERHLSRERKRIEISSSLLRDLLLLSFLFLFLCAFSVRPNLVPRARTKIILIRRLSPAVCVHSF